MKNKLFKLSFCLHVFAVFSLIGFASLHYQPTAYSETAYDPKQVKTLDILLAQIDPQTMQEKQAAALRSLWNIKAGETESQLEFLK